MSLGATRIGAGARVVERHPRERCDRGVVLDLTARGDVAAVPVIGRAAQAHVRPDQQLGHAALIAAMARAASPCGSVASLASASLRPGAANTSTARTPAAATSRACRAASSTESWKIPGMLSTGRRTALPGTTNSG